MAWLPLLHRSEKRKGAALFINIKDNKSRKLLATHDMYMMYVTDVRVLLSINS